MEKSIFKPCTYFCYELIELPNQIIPVDMELEGETERDTEAETKSDFYVTSQVIFSNWSKIFF